MNVQELDAWWSHLTIADKERIAAKGWSIDHDEDVPYGQNPVPYPKCTSWWNLQTNDRKQFIHDHCTDKHGVVIMDWTEGKPVSY